MEAILIWKAVDVSEQRVRFVIRASSGQEEMKALCLEFEISRPTGYLWLKRYRECERLQELAEASRRPHRSPKQTAAEKEQRVIALRHQYPDWGAGKLVELLKREQIQIPRITVHRILLRNGLVRDRDRHRAATQRFEREAPNQLWQMDFKGMPTTRPGCLPLVVLDDHSRYLLGLFGTAGTKGEPVQKNLTAIFRRDGLPEAMLMDHGTPWWNARSSSGWTWLTVWLMKQGIGVYLSGYRHPQTQGKIERCNGSLEAAMFKGRNWMDRAGNPGWMRIAKNTIMSVPMKLYRWTCRRAAGSPACVLFSRNSQRGSTPIQRRSQSAGKRRREPGGAELFRQPRLHWGERAVAVRGESSSGLVLSHSGPRVRSSDGHISSHSRTTDAASSHPRAVMRR